MPIYSSLEQSIRNGTIKALLEYFPKESDQDDGIIFSHTNGPEPSHPYVVINILNITQQGRGSVSTLTDSNKLLDVVGVYEVLVQFTFCGSTAPDMAHHFSQRVGNNPVVSESFRSNNLGIMRSMDIQRMPRLRDTKWVEYLNQRVYFSYIVKTAQVIDYVESVVIKNEETGKEYTIAVEGQLNP